MIDTVIFDMDGVICNTNPFHSMAFENFFEKRGLKPTEEEYKNHMYGKSNSYIFSHFLDRSVSGKELMEFENEKEGLFREIYKDHVVDIKGYLSFAKKLATLKYKLGVATSAPTANMDLILDHLKIRSLYSSTLASEDVTKHKPEPEVYLKSAKNLNADPSTCLVFEDSHAGVSAAINAGMKVVGVLSSHTKDELPPCDHYIKEYGDELIDVVGVL